MLAIDAHNITKSYNGELCLQGVDLQIEQGKFVSVMGASGSGKSTLLEILAGVRFPDSGSVLLSGNNLFEMNAGQSAKFRRTHIGIVYQNFSLISTLSGFDNIALPLILENDRKDLKERVCSLCDRLFLPDTVLNKFPYELSGGQQQRVALARAMIYKPQILFLDEPTGSLDTKNTKNVLDLLKEYNEQNSATIIQITHSEKDAYYACSPDNVLRMVDGVIQ